MAIINVNGNNVIVQIQQADLERDVSQQAFSILTMVRGQYNEIGSSGVYTQGTFPPRPSSAVAVSGMASCGGIVLTRGAQNLFTDYLAIHIAGDAGGIVEFREVINRWIVNTQGNGQLHAYGATGGFASTDYVVSRFQANIQAYTNLPGNAFDIYIHAGILMVTRSGVVTASSNTAIQTVAPQCRPVCNIL